MDSFVIKKKISYKTRQIKTIGPDLKMSMTNFSNALKANIKVTSSAYHLKSQLPIIRAKEEEASSRMLLNEATKWKIEHKKARDALDLIEDEPKTREYAIASMESSKNLREYDECALLWAKTLENIKLVVPNLNAAIGDIAKYDTKWKADT